MDFFKTLMLYMTLTFATSVQGAPVPEVTEMPTATPPAVVITQAPEAGETAAPDASDAAAPASTETEAAAVTPAPAATEEPVPTITPNTAYRNLKQGDKGERVKKLQARLIELGYLTGEADGAFGGQTYRAVLSFQAANGLQRDGVAGDATQTRLFEDPNVVENPDRATETPAPTDTPAPPVEPEAIATLAQPETTIAAPNPTAIIPAAADEEGRTWLWNASIVVNDSGETLTCLRREDGVMVASKPRLWKAEDGSLLLSLDDLSFGMDDWALMTDESGVTTLQAAGYIVALTPADGAYTCTVDGEAVELAPGDVTPMQDEIAVSEAFLQKVFGAQTTWDAEESTLMIRLQNKDVAQATD